MWEFVELDEDDTSSIDVVFLTPKIVDTIRRAKTKALFTIKLSVKYQIILIFSMLRILKNVGMSSRDALKCLTILEGWLFIISFPISAWRKDLVLQILCIQSKTLSTS